MRTAASVACFVHVTRWRQAAEDGYNLMLLMLADQKDLQKCHQQDQCESKGLQEELPRNDMALDGAAARP